MFEAALLQFTPRPRVRSLAWFVRFVRNIEGRAYDHDAFPYFGAPGGPCDALDDDEVRHVWLQFGIRMGKSLFGHAAQLWLADTNPRPQLLASTNQTLARQLVGRTYKMAEQITSTASAIGRPLADQLVPEYRRSHEAIKLDASTIFAAWSGSATTLADRDVWFGWAGEVDKWQHERAATEGEPLQRFLDRASNHPARKYVIEGSPTIKGKSRIERGLGRSTACRFYVPCPHKKCGKFQTLELGNGKAPGGIQWRRRPDGTHDPELARRTACYVCVHCKRKIGDEYRGAMMRGGVWAPEGCGVIDRAARLAAAHWFDNLAALEGAETGDGLEIPAAWSSWSACPWVVGKPARDGPDAGYQLSRLYDLSITWGDLAATFVTVKDRPAELRSYKNEWLAETWQEVGAAQAWHELAFNQAGEYDRATIPAAAWFLTVGVDVQDDRAYWVARAWGEAATSWLVDFGCVRKPIDDAGRATVNGDLEQLDPLVIDRAWPVIGKTTEGHTQLWAALVCVDTGHRIHDVHTFMRARPGGRVRAVAGDANVRSGYYRASTLERNARTGKPYVGGLVQWQLNVDAFKDDLHGRWKVSATTPGAWFLPRDLQGDAAGVDYLRQVVNEAPTTIVNNRGHHVRRWKVVHESIGNHYFDCEVYARAGAEMIAEGDWLASPAADPPELKRPPDQAGRTRRASNRRTFTRRRGK
jgi:phage terminase large subunit GpA-like protein